MKHFKVNNPLLLQNNSSFYHTYVRAFMLLCFVIEFPYRFSPHHISIICVRREMFSRVIDMLQVFLKNIFLHNTFGITMFNERVEGFGNSLGICLVSMILGLGI